MEKGFNDQELADIMNEIENLEKEFTQEMGNVGGAVETHKASEHEDHKMGKTASLEASTDWEDSSDVEAESEEDGSEVEVRSSLPPKAHTGKFSSKKTMPPTRAHDVNRCSKMSFKIEGEVSMELGFEVGGEHLQLNIDEHHLHLTLSSGASFSFPLNEKLKSKKAA
jgi:hypothetical protein